MTSVNEPVVKMKGYRALPNSVSEASYAHREYDVTPESETPFERILQPEYWAHVSAKFRRFDRIHIMPADASYYAELLVIAVPDTDANLKTWVKVALLRKVEFTAKQENGSKEFEIPDGYEVKFRGPQKWSALQGKNLLKEGMASREEVVNWLIGYLKQIDA